jgi:predicted DNA binding CopG/RHH family protein
MKKATPEMVTMTLEEVRKRKLPMREKEQLKKLAAMPDEQIDTSDIPEIADFSGGVRGRFYRPVTQSVTIRLNAPDVDAARRLSRLKGMPYQTYIKALLHDALVREAKSAVAEVSRPQNKRGS